MGESICDSFELATANDNLCLSCGHGKEDHEVQLGEAYYVVTIRAKFPDRETLIDFMGTVRNIAVYMADNVEVTHYEAE